MPVDDDKQRLRRHIRAERKAAFRESGDDAAEALARHILALAELSTPRTIAGYWAVGSEISVAPLMAALCGRGWTVVLPVVVAHGAPLLFRRWRPGDELAEGPLKTLQPHPSCGERTPDVVLTPLLAFDGEGYRLGQGGGFYDRTLEGLKARNAGVLSIGVGFSVQRVDRVPRDSHDQRLDLIVTDRGRV